MYGFMPVLVVEVVASRVRNADESAQGNENEARSSGG
jgi:hypothetical protein